MSSEQINIAIGAAQLLLALCVFFRVDHRIVGRFMNRHHAEPELGLGVPITTPRRGKLLLILIFGGLAFSVYGFYQTLQPPVPHQNKVSTKNVEVHVRRWLEGLMVS